MARHDPVCKLGDVLSWQLLVITLTQNTNESQVSVAPVTVHNYVLNLTRVLYWLSRALLTVLVRVPHMMDCVVSSRSQLTALCLCVHADNREMERTILKLHTATDLAQAVALGRNPCPLCEDLLLWRLLMPSSHCQH